MSDEINDIADHLEQEEENMDVSQWDIAHDKYDNNEPEMLENMVNSLTTSHALKTIKEYNGAFSKKGEYLDYDEWHSFSASAAIVGLSYVWHPLALTLWAYITKKIFDHSHGEVKKTSTDHWVETVDVFGKELWYYLGGALLSAWFFEEFTGYSLNLGDAGTMAQIFLEVSKFFIAG